jgi:hypothetical protein
MAVADFNTIAGHVATATAELKKAMAAIAINDRVTLQTSYLLGHVRACVAVCDSASEFIRETQTTPNVTAAPSAAAR